MITPCLLAALLLGSPAPPAPKKPLQKKAPPAFQVRIFTLPALLGEKLRDSNPLIGRIFLPWTPPPDSKPPQALLLSSMPIHWLPCDPDASKPFASPGDLKEILSCWAGEKLGTQSRESIRKVDSALDTPPDRIMVSQTPEAMKKIEEYLRTLQQGLRPRYSFKAVLFLAPRNRTDKPFQVLDPTRGEAIFQEIENGRFGRVLHIARGNCMAWDSIFLGKTRSVSFIPDLEVEIAQKASIANPETRTLKLNQGLALAPTPSFRCNATEISGLVIFQEPKASPKAMGLQTIRPRMIIEKARIENLQMEFSLSFKDRLALLMAPGGWRRPNLRVLLLAKRLDPTPDFPEGRAILSPIYTSTSFSVGFFDNKWASSYPSCDFFLDILKGDKFDRLNFLQMNTGIFLKGPKEVLNRAISLAESIYKGFQRKFRMEVIREKIPVEPYGVEEKDWTLLGLPTVIPCLGGRSAFVLLGEEENYVSDYDEEVAAKTEISDPQVKRTFDGSQILVRVDPAGEVCAVKLDILEQSLLGFRRIPSAEITKCGTIEAPDLRWVHWNRRYLMRPGETRLLGFGPPRRIGDRLYRTRVSIRLIED